MLCYLWCYSVFSGLALSIQWVATMATPSLNKDPTKICTLPISFIILTCKHTASIFLHFLCVWAQPKSSVCFSHDYDKGFIIYLEKDHIWPHLPEVWMQAVNCITCELWASAKFELLNRWISEKRGIYMTLHFVNKTQSTTA